MGVLRVVPGESGRELGETGVQRLRAAGALAACIGRDDPDLADHPAVAVPLVPADFDGLAGNEARQVLARALAERLVALGRVDTGETDLD